MPMPAAVVLFVCKVAFTPYASITDEHNAKYTGHKPFEWATEHSMMECRRLRVDLHNPDDPKAEFTIPKCLRASWQVRMGWDKAHDNSNWRVWATACPVPIANTATGKIIDWKMPECPRVNKKDRVAVHCEVDTAI